MKPKNILTCSAEKGGVPATRAVWMLLLGTVAIVWPYTPDSAIGRESSVTAVMSLSTPDSNQPRPSLQDLLSALHQENAYDRQRAVIALGNTKNIQAVGPLIQSLQDDDDFVRNFAARALGDIGDPKALNPLIQALSDKHILVRCSAARALGSLKDSRAVDPLINALESGDFLVQRSAAEALGEIGDPKAIDPLIKALGNEDSYIQMGAANALARIGQPAIPKLVIELGKSKLAHRAAEILKELYWQPSSEQEKTKLDMALRNLQSGLND
jgi:HEAT repeat protein